MTLFSRNFIGLAAGRVLGAMLSVAAAGGCEIGRSAPPTNAARGEGSRRLYPGFRTHAGRIHPGQFRRAMSSKGVFILRSPARCASNMPRRQSASSSFPTAPGVTIKNAARTRPRNYPLSQDAAAARPRRRINLSQRSQCHGRRDRGRADHDHAGRTEEDCARPSHPDL